MSVIENFSMLSEAELKAFAEALVKTINSEGIFTSETAFKIYEIDADETTGNLYIGLETEENVLVEREATWTCGDEDEIHSDPGYEADFADTCYDDAKKAFKTMKAELEGYDLDLSIDDMDEVDTDEVIVDNYHEDDAGIGHYEYWGHTGYDSQPYFEVEGTIVKACSIALTLTVSAAEPAPVEESEEQVE